MIIRDFAVFWHRQQFCILGTFCKCAIIKSIDCYQVFQVLDAGVCRSAQECVRVRRSAQECAGMCRNVEECAGVRRSAQECWGVCRSVQECAGVLCASAQLESEMRCVRSSSFLEFLKKNWAHLWMVKLEVSIVVLFHSLHFKLRAFWKSLESRIFLPRLLAKKKPE